MVICVPEGLSDIAGLPSSISIPAGYPSIPKQIVHSIKDKA